MAHTPGPWALHDMEFATVVTKAKPGQFIALCDAVGVPDDESTANARLIAAAPDLLEALQEMLFLAIIGGEQEKARARAAIAAAKGEPS